VRDPRIPRPIGIGLSPGGVSVRLAHNRYMSSASGVSEARVPDPGAGCEGSGVEGASQIGLTVAAVARRLGVAPATLRTWDRRYGIGPSQHAAGAHRRYNAEDLARLDRMRRLVLAGVSPGEAARAATSEAAIDADSGIGTSTPATFDTESVASPTGRHGGGRVVAMPGGAPAARGLARAALALDSEACRTLVAETVERRGVVWTWDHLLLPVLVSVGQRWEQTGEGIEVEHVLSEAIQSVFAEMSRRVALPRNSRPVLLAGSEHEQHTLPLWAVAAGLAERGVTSRMMGARMPTSALSEAMRRTGPGAVLVWSQVADTGDTNAINDLPELRPDPLIILAGPGWTSGSTRARRVYDLTGALEELCRAVGV
jgi:MerR family transcriptional regulator, light-induced transcriptional regulator